MNTLDSYNNPDDPLNKLIHKRAPNVLATKKATTVYFSATQAVNPAPAIHSGGYPFTPLGELGGFYIKDGHQQEIAVHQISNRHGIPFDPSHATRADQLILLDTGDVQQIKDALANDHDYTNGSKMLPGLNSSSPVLNDAARDVMMYWDKGVNHPLVKQGIATLSTDVSAYNLVAAFINDPKRVKGKFLRHDVKSGGRMRNHYASLYHSKSIHFASETRGEYAAAKLMVTVMGSNYQMKIGKASSGRTNGIDQIWVKRNMQTGAVEEYLIIECKGSADAHLGEAKYGRQMSARWVFYCLIGMLGTNGNLASTATGDIYAKQSLVKKILNALINPGHPPVTGMVIQPMSKAKTDPDSIDIMEFCAYSLISEYAAAKIEQSGGVITKQVVTGLRD